MSSPEVKRRKQQAMIAHAGRVIRATKIAAGCCDCGYREHPDALHFDHRDPATKRRDLGWYDDRSKLITAARLDAYLDHVASYCDVRCANCHAIRTNREQHWRRRTHLSDPCPPLFPA